MSDTFSTFAKKLSRYCELKDLVSEKVELDNFSALKRIHSKNGPTDIYNRDEIPEDVDYLIETTDYQSYGEEEEIPNENRRFLLYRKNSAGPRRLEEKTYDEMIAEGPQPAGVFEKPEKPKLGLFSWLRHKLSFIFGEPDAIKKYERKMEVYHAKKMDMIEKEYGCSDLFRFDRALADKTKAENYIERGNVANFKKGEKPEEKSSEEKIPEENIENTGRYENYEQDSYAARDATRRVKAKGLVEYMAGMYDKNAKLPVETERVIKLVSDTILHDGISGTEAIRQQVLVDYLWSLRKKNDPVAFDKMIKALGKTQELNSEEDLLEMVAESNSPSSPLYSAFVANMAESDIIIGGGGSEKGVPANTEQKGKENVPSS